jgi:predicted nucleotidyltransferase component of viral defense system
VNLVVQEMLKKFKDALSPMNKLREILQFTALLGLARHQFFEQAVFYGGTALRILHGLDRYSEDLDFSLLKADPQFDFSPFLHGMQREMEGMGFELEVQVRQKNQETGIWSAFLKANTLVLLLSIEEKGVVGVHPEQKIQIKIEIDTDPPAFCATENILVENPIPFYVKTFSLENLFAGKMHAVLCRAWQKRVKGRDWYDLIWYIQNKIPVNLSHLRDRMQQTKQLQPEESLGPKELVERLQNRIHQIDWKLAKEDMVLYIADMKQVEIWSVPFFLDLIKKLQFS